MCGDQPAADMEEYSREEGAGRLHQGGHQESGRSFPRTIYSGGGRGGELRIRAAFFSKHHAHTSRFSAAHTLGEEQPADYARDEICGRGAVAEGTGSGAGGAALCAGTGASATFDDGAHSRAATSAAGA